MTRVLICISCFFLFLVRAWSENLADVAAAVNPAIVTIRSGSGVQSVGTGFLVNPDGVLLTNKQVVGTEKTVTVELLDHKTFSAEVIYTDPVLDLALVRLPVHNLPVLTIADPSGIKKGQPALAIIGNALGQSPSVTRGIVSNPDVTIDGQHYLQTDSALNHGNSGGPLLNEQRQVIGITTAMAKQAEKVGLALPLSTILPLLEQQHVAVVTELHNTATASRTTAVGPVTPTSAPATTHPLPQALPTSIPMLLIAILLAVIAGITTLLLRRRMRQQPATGADMEIYLHPDKEKDADIDIELH